MPIRKSTHSTTYILGRSKKVRTPPTEEISAVRRGGGGDCLKMS